MYLVELTSNCGIYKYFFTFTSSNTTGQVDDARIPSLFSFFNTDKPGVSLSTANVVIPLYPYK